MTAEERHKRETAVKNQRGLRKVVVAFLATMAIVLLPLLSLSPIFAAIVDEKGVPPEPAAPATQPGIDFRQAANNDPALGEVHWIGSILQKSNSVYYEGMSVPQRIIISGISNITGNTHSLTLSHQVVKNGIHAYDFLTSWEQAQKAADVIAPGQNLLQNLNTCGDSIHETARASCDAIESAGYEAFAVIPDTMGDPPSMLGSNVDTKIANYESHPDFLNRTVRIAGTAEFIEQDPLMTFDGYTSSGGSDYAHYTLTWTSEPSESVDIRIELAGHLSVGDDYSGLKVGYGPGLGASNISGGPYHFSLHRLENGAQLGNKDNQIMGSDILAPSPVVECDADPNPTTVGQLTSFNATASGGVGPYNWYWDFGDGVGTSTDEDPTYIYTTAGSYNACVTVTDSLGNVGTCCTDITVNPSSPPPPPPVVECDVDPKPTTVGELTSFSATASGGAGDYNYAWDFGDGVGTSTDEDPTYTYTAAGTYEACVTVTDSLGTETCCTDITVNPSPTPTPTPTPTIQLAILLDGSGSITSIEWDTQINGLIAALGNASCIPRDGARWSLR